MNNQIMVNMPVGLATAYDRNYKIPSHIEKINKALIDVALGKTKKLIINMPPRHGKSELISKYFVAWYLLNFTNKRVILTSYEADFAASWGRKVKDVINTFGKQYKTRIRRDSNASNRFELLQGGQLNTAGAGGAITGKGADILIIDDPIKNIEEANSKVLRQKVWEWFTTTAFTRLEPDGAVIIIMTRWHYDDLVGRILNNPEERKQWTWLSLPAINENNEALWAERFSIDKLNEIKNTLGSMHFSALYQQKPVATENQIYKYEWW
ncbi:MAG: terminase family protein, partial [Bacilli bacterium]